MVTYQQVNEIEREDIADWILKQAERDLQDLKNELDWLTEGGVANSDSRLIALKVIAKHRYGDRPSFNQDWGRL